MHEPGSLAKPRVVTHVEKTMCWFRKMKEARAPGPSAMATSFFLLSCLGLEHCRLVLLWHLVRVPSHGAETCVCVCVYVSDCV